MNTDFSSIYPLLTGLILLCCTDSLAQISKGAAKDRWGNFRQTLATVCWPDSVELRCPVRMHLLVMPMDHLSLRAGRTLTPPNQSASSPSCLGSTSPGLPNPAPTCLSNRQENIEKRLRQLCEGRQTCQVASDQLLVNSTACPMVVANPAPIAYKCVPNEEVSLMEVICADTYMEVKCDPHLSAAGTSLAILSAQLARNVKRPGREELNDCPESATIPLVQNDRKQLDCHTRIDVTDRLRELCDGRPSCSASPNMKMAHTAEESMTYCGKLHLSLTYVCVATETLDTAVGGGSPADRDTIAMEDEDVSGRRRKSQRQPKEIQETKVQRPSDNSVDRTSFINDGKPNESDKRRHPLSNAYYRTQADPTSSLSTGKAPASGLIQPLTIGLVIGLLLTFVCAATLALVCRSVYRRSSLNRKPERGAPTGRTDDSLLFGPSLKDQMAIPVSHYGRHASKASKCDKPEFNSSPSIELNAKCPGPLEIPSLMGSDVVYPCRQQQQSDNLQTRTSNQTAMGNYTQPTMCPSGFAVDADAALLSTSMPPIFDQGASCLEGSFGQPLLAGSFQVRANTGSVSPVNSNHASFRVATSKLLETVPFSINQMPDQLYNRVDNICAYTPTPVLCDSGLHKTSSLTGTSASGRGCDGNSGHSEASDACPNASVFPGGGGDLVANQDGVLFRMRTPSYRYPGDCFYDPVTSDPCNSTIYSPASNTSRSSNGQAKNNVNFHGYMVDFSQHRNASDEAVRFESFCQRLGSCSVSSNRINNCPHPQPQMTTSMLYQQVAPSEGVSQSKKALKSSLETCFQEYHQRVPHSAETTRISEVDWSMPGCKELIREKQASSESLSMPLIEPPSNFRSPPATSDSHFATQPIQCMGSPNIYHKGHCSFTTDPGQGQTRCEVDESEVLVEEPPPGMPPLRGLRLGNHFHERTLTYISPP